MPKVIRFISDLERDTTRLLLNKAGIEGSTLIEQLESCAMVKPTNPDETIVEFQLAERFGTPQPRPDLHGGLEAIGKDLDGAQLHVILHICYGRLDALEYLREDSIEARHRPNPADFESFDIPWWMVPGTKIP